MGKILSFILLFLYPVLNMQGMSLIHDQEQPRHLLNKAKTLIYTEPDEAVRLSAEALAKAGGNTALQVSSLIVSASAYAEKADGDKAIRCLLKAQEIVNREKDFVNQIRILGMLGYQYQNLQMNDKARFYLNAAEQINKYHPLPDSLQYLKGNIFSIKGLSYRDDLDCDFANEYFNKAIAVYKLAKGYNMANTNLSVTYIHKGNCFIDKSELDSAVYVFQQAGDLIRENKLQGDIIIMQKTGLAKIHFLKNEYSESIQILKEALQISEKLSQLDSRTQIYQLLAENYLQINDLKNYRYFNKLYVDDVEKLSESEKKTLNRTLHFQYNENEKQLKNNMSQYAVYSIIGVVLIVLLITLLLFKAYKMNKKVKQLKDSISKNPQL